MKALTKRARRTVEQVKLQMDRPYKVVFAGREIRWQTWNEAYGCAMRLSHIEKAGVYGWLRMQWFDHGKLDN